MANKDTKKEIPIGGGLLELPYDERDFSRDLVFGSVRAEELPTTDFMVAPILEIKDQGESDLCTAYATTSASEDQEEVVLDPFFTFFATKVLVQKDPDSWGADLRSACKSHVKHGALEAELSPFRVFDRRPERKEILDLNNWIEDHKMLAYEHRKTSFFAVDGPHDTFDNIRSALWAHRKKMRSVITGCKWYGSWTLSEDGVIPTTEGGGFPTPHAFILKGQRYFNGDPYLVAQLSNGEDIGEKGVFYLPRSVVNKEFRYGNYMFEDISVEKAKNHMYYGTRHNENVFSKIFKIFSRLLIDSFKSSHGRTN